MRLVKRNIIGKHGFRTITRLEFSDGSVYVYYDGHYYSGEDGKRCSERKTIQLRQACVATAEEESRRRTEGDVVRWLQEYEEGFKV